MNESSENKILSQPIYPNYDGDGDVNGNNNDNKQDSLSIWNKCRKNGFSSIFVFKYHHLISRSRWWTAAHLSVLYVESDKKKYQKIHIYRYTNIIIIIPLSKRYCRHSRWPCFGYVTVNTYVQGIESIFWLQWMNLTRFFFRSLHSLPILTVFIWFISFAIKFEMWINPLEHILTTDFSIWNYLLLKNAFSDISFHNNRSKVNRMRFAANFHAHLGVWQ